MSMFGDLARFSSRVLAALDIAAMNEYLAMMISRIFGTYPTPPYRTQAQRIVSCRWISYIPVKVRAAASFFFAAGWDGMG